MEYDFWSSIFGVRSLGTIFGIIHTGSVHCTGYGVHTIDHMNSNLSFKRTFATEMNTLSIYNRLTARNVRLSIGRLASNGLFFAPYIPPCICLEGSIWDISFHHQRNHRN